MVTPSTFFAQVATVPARIPIRAVQAIGSEIKSIDVKELERELLPRLVDALKAVFALRKDSTEEVTSTKLTLDINRENKKRKHDQRTPPEEKGCIDGSQPSFSQQKDTNMVKKPRGWPKARIPIQAVQAIGPEIKSIDVKELERELLPRLVDALTAVFALRKDSTEEVTSTKLTLDINRENKKRKDDQRTPPEEKGCIEGSQPSFSQQKDTNMVKKPRGWPKGKTRKPRDESQDSLRSRSTSRESTHKAPSTSLGYPGTPASPTPLSHMEEMPHLQPDQVRSLLQEPETLDGLVPLMTPASTEELLEQIANNAPSHSTSLPQSDRESLQRIQQDLPLSTIDNMGYNQSQLQMANMGYDENISTQIPSGAMSERVQSPWHADYDFSASAGPADEQMENETDEEFEERVLKKRAFQLFTQMRSKFQQTDKLYFSEMCLRHSRKHAAQKFYSLLVLKKFQVLELEQSEAYEEIHISRSPKFENPTL
ncbi:hypothetical protein RN001_012723 [Aquatica leii]|uniref:Rad21/Rec8-like protein C-terminal eukaryotic domain-containing protein n=1 Tax=Aquatica leii TaxID=1421715 RepID=A0AAN7S7W6_9COLE|nr:hypothetical protein RN001_012723 [Aquatica leii]